VAHIARLESGEQEPALGPFPKGNGAGHGIIVKFSDSNGFGSPFIFEVIFAPGFLGAGGLLVGGDAAIQNSGQWIGELLDWWIGHIPPVGGSWRLTLSGLILARGRDLGEPLAFELKSENGIAIGVLGSTDLLAGGSEGLFTVEWSMDGQFNAAEHIEDVELWFHRGVGVRNKRARHAANEPTFGAAAGKGACAPVKFTEITLSAAAESTGAGL
jgi:hypothetical protein